MKKTRKKLLAIALAVVMLAATCITATAAEIQTIQIPTGMASDSYMTFSNVISYHKGYVVNDVFEFSDPIDSSVYVEGPLGSRGMSINEVYTIRVANSTSIVYKDPTPSERFGPLRNIEVAHDRSKTGQGAVSTGLEFANLPGQGNPRGVVSDSWIQINNKGVYLIIPNSVMSGQATNSFLIFVEDSVQAPAGDPRLVGADDWATPGLTEALARGLVTDAMIGNWKEDASRLQAADAMVKVIESVTGKTIDQIANEKGFDMNDRFADTNSKSATFLKASGISQGMDGVNYGAASHQMFTRAQFVTMLGRMAENVFDMDLSGYPLGSVRFVDITVGAPWADRYIGWAAEVGITQGTGGATFGSGNYLQNQQLGVFMNRSYDVLK